MARALQVVVGAGYLALFGVTRGLYYLLKGASWLMTELERTYEDLREW